MSQSPRPHARQNPTLKGLQQPPIHTNTEFSQLKTSPSITAPVHEPVASKANPSRSEAPSGLLGSKATSKAATKTPVRTKTTRKASSSPSGVGAVAADDKPQRKRPRAALACEQCRARKYRCDEQFPCRTCSKHGWECVYRGGHNFRRNQAAPSYVAELEGEVKALRARLGLEAVEGGDDQGVGRTTAAASSYGEQRGRDGYGEQGKGNNAAGIDVGQGRGTSSPLPRDPKRASRSDAEAARAEGSAALASLAGVATASPAGRAAEALTSLSAATRDQLPPGANRKDDGAAAGITAGAAEAEDAESTSDPNSMVEGNNELRDVNEHTNSIEFHGSTSSIAFLALARGQQQASERDPSGNPPNDLPPSRASLVSTLHNSAFLEGTATEHENGPDAGDARNFRRQANMFLDTFFHNHHHIHPILDKGEFERQCEALWCGRLDPRQQKPFLALYYSVMALGVATRIWPAEQREFDGLTRSQWILRFFDQAQHALGQVRTANDIESVQALFLLAKVCQNSLNPHMAYMFLGMATRACLSAGYHREPPPSSSSGSSASSNGESKKAAAISRLWWGLYGFEMEVSFSLGRPDGLGPDEHHNRRLPLLTGGETDIIPCMVDFARITRKVALFMCASSRATVRDKIARASAIAAEMEEWRLSLPEMIRPSGHTRFAGSRILKHPVWARRQKLVLHLRYCNIRMVLFRPFLICALTSRHRPPQPLLEAVRSCIEAAEQTIDAIFDVFLHYHFFRSWFYNTTYVLYAGTIVLCCANRLGGCADQIATLTGAASACEGRARLLRYVEMTIEVLEIMEECSVAREAANLLRQGVSTARERYEQVKREHEQQQTRESQQYHATLPSLPIPHLQPHHLSLPHHQSHSSGGSPPQFSTQATTPASTGFPPTPDSSVQGATPTSTSARLASYAPPPPPLPPPPPPPSSLQLQSHHYPTHQHQPDQQQPHQHQPYQNQPHHPPQFPPIHPQQAWPLISPSTPSSRLHHLENPVSGAAVPGNPPPTPFGSVSDPPLTLPLLEPKREFASPQLQLPPRLPSEQSFNEVLDEPMPHFSIDQLFGDAGGYNGLLTEENGGFAGWGGPWAEFGGMEGGQL